MGKNTLLADSYIATGQATAFARGMSPERMAERAAAYADRESREQQLRTLKATEPTAADRRNMADAQSLELQNALETQKQMLRENNKRTTFSAYERYDADGDVRHINSMLRDLSNSGSNLYGNIARVDKLTESDRNMLEDEMGLPPQLVDMMLNDPELSKSYVKITQKDGSTSFGDLDALKGVTGYNDYATAKELDRQKKAREIENLSILGYDADPTGREAFRRTRAQLGPDVDPKSSEFQNLYTENYDKLKTTYRRGTNVNVNGSTGSQTELEEAAWNRAKLEGLEPGTSEFLARYEEYKDIITDEWRKSSAVRNTEAADTAEDTLMEMGFFDLNMDELTQTERYKIGQQIRKIEGPGGGGLSENDKKTLMRIRKLTTLGEMASDLTEDQTGFIDAPLRKFKKYLSNDVEGIDAESAYQSFRNLVLHSFYGSALTPTESENFLKAFGALTQQQGPVLQQLRTTMEELRDAYRTVADLNNAFVIKWRTGKTQEELYDVLDSLDERIQYIKDVQAGNVVPYATTNDPIDSDTKPATEIRPDIRRKLDELAGKTTPGVPE